MAVDVIEFSPELVTEIWERAKATNPDQFRHEELDILTQNLPLRNLHTKLLVDANIRYQGGPDADRTVRGFLVGHQVLHQAFNGKLPVLDAPLIVDHGELLIREPGILDHDFSRDYREQPAILDLVGKKIESNSARQGAKLILELYAGFVNPDRPPVTVARRMPRMSRQAVRHAQQTYARNRIPR